MMKLKHIIVITISIAFFSCAPTQKQTSNDGSSNDGSSIEKAIKVGSVDQEYKIVREKCEDCKFKGQGLIFNSKDKPFDVLTFIKPNGEEVKYYFDISKFYGKF